MTFEQAKKNLYDKNLYINNYLNYMFSKTNELFIYENLPDNLDVSKLEYFLQKFGFVFFTRNENSYHFYNGSLFDYDIYDEPRKINANIEINNNPTTKTFDVLNDGVLIKNDFLKLGLKPIFEKYGCMLNEAEITLYLHTILNRVSYVISCTDDKTKKEADTFLKKIYDGDFSIIGSSAFFEGVELKGVPGSMNYTKDDIELTQYIRASAFHEIGLNSNFNMKRQYLNSAETSMNEKSIKPFVENMLSCRLEAIQKINEKYGLNIKVSMSSLWDSFTPFEQGGDKGEKENEKTINENVDNIKEETEDKQGVKNDKES